MNTEEPVKVFTPMKLVHSSKPTLEQAMNQLYAAEINCSIHSFWDGGWTVRIGDEMNGHSATRYFDNEDIGDIPQWLVDNAHINTTK